MIPRWLPNVITLVRIVLIPVFVWLATETQAAAVAGQPHGAWRVTTLLALLGIGVSDLLDGYLARKYGLTTAFGATMDAVADKLAQIAFLVYFTLTNGPAFTPFPWWFLALIIIRDIVLGVGWLILRMTKGHVQVVHEHHGRLASCLLFALAFWITAGGGPAVVGVAVFVIAAVVVASTAGYARDGWAQLGSTNAPST